MVERLSLSDNSLVGGYAENIQRSEFALAYCQGKRVLDAGCGSGYGSYFLASNGAMSVLAVDISDEAIIEATRSYQLANLHFERRDVQTLTDEALSAQFDVVVNFEVLAHLPDPEKFIRGVTTVLVQGGTLVTSTPNGELVDTDQYGRPLYKYQYKAYMPDDFKSFLSAHFREVSIYGHWLTHQGMLRKMRARELFEQLCEAYYNPMCRVGRAIKRMAGKKAAGPPIFRGAADSYVGDYVILPLGAGGLRWPPSTLIAVCKT